MAATPQSERHVQAVMAALGILDCFEKEPALTLKQIIDLTGLTRNRIMRLTGTLEECGYLTRSGTGGRFRLGPKLLVLGKVYERNYDLIRLARPIVKKLARETGESASLYVIDGQYRLVLVREEGTQAVRYTVNEGQRLPLYAGASGKVLLAFGPESLSRDLIGRDRLESLTPNTIATGQDLAQELESIRAQGFAVSEAERNPDAASVAAPVFNHRQDLVGAMSIAGPISRMGTREQVEPAATVAAAAELSRLLGDPSEG